MVMIYLQHIKFLTRTITSLCKVSSSSDRLDKDLASFEIICQKDRFCALNLLMFGAAVSLVGAQVTHLGRSAKSMPGVVPPIQHILRRNGSDYYVNTRRSNFLLFPDN